MPPSVGTYRNYQRCDIKFRQVCGFLTIVSEANKEFKDQNQNELTNEIVKSKAILLSDVLLIPGSLKSAKIFLKNFLSLTSALFIPLKTYSKEIVDILEKCGLNIAYCPG